MPIMNPNCQPPSIVNCDPNQIPSLQSDEPVICVSGGFIDPIQAYAPFTVSGSGWAATVASTPYFLGCIDRKWNISWEGESPGNEDATGGSFPDLTFPSFATSIVTPGTCSWCGQCMGPVSSLPATLYWHNQTTSQEVTLSHDGGYVWSDSTNTYSFFCDEASKTLMASDASDTGIESCNNSDPIDIDYTFTVNGETIVIDTIAP